MEQVKWLAAAVLSCTIFIFGLGVLILPGMLLLPLFRLMSMSASP